MDAKSPELLLFVDLSYACFGLFADEASGKVVAAPPIARFTIGWTAERAGAYYRGKGGKVTERMPPSKKTALYVDDYAR